MAKIGEFELLTLLAILRQAESPYANEVRRDLEENAQRSVSRGALYRTLDRLADKGWIAWELEPSDLGTRGGRPRRRLQVTAAGLAVARGQRKILLRFFEGLDPVGDR